MITNIQEFSLTSMCFIINIYSDNQQFTLKYLKDTEVKLNNILIMIRDFNIRDNIWDFLYPHHSTHTDTLREIADSLNLNVMN